MQLEAAHQRENLDTPDADEILRQAEAKRWKLTDIWNTHWHPDHAGGNADIVAITGARVTGPAEVERLMMWGQASGGSRRPTTSD